MRIWNRNRRITAMVAALALVTLCFATPAWAVLEDVIVQTQLQYQFFESKSGDGPVDSHGNFNTTYNIGFRRPILPFAKLITNLTINSMENNDTLGRQQNRTLNFSMSAAERTYSMNAGVDNVTYSSFITSGDQQFANKGTNNNYYLNLNWNESPSMPQVNLQLRKNKTTVGAGSVYDTNQFVLGAIYDINPFRLTLDQSTQKFSFGSETQSNRTTTNRRRAGIDFDQQILPGLALQARMERETTRTSFTDRTSDSTNDTRNIRLTATPTPSLLLSAEKNVQGTSLDSGLFSQDSRTNNTIYSLRSEILSGLSFSASHQKSEQTGDIIGTNNTNTSANINARLTSDANLALGWNRSSYNQVSGSQGNKQTNIYGSLQMPLGLDNDFSTDFGTMNSKSGGADDFRGRYLGVSIRNRTRSDMSLGLGYRWSVLDTFAGSKSSQKNNNVDFDLSWFPAGNMGINARLSYSSINGSSVSDYITPTVDIRWDVSSNSNLTMRYNFNRARQWDWNQGQILQQDARGLSGRFSYRLNNDSSLDATYDFLSSQSISTQWQRALRIFFTTKL